MSGTCLDHVLKWLSFVLTVHICLTLYWAAASDCNGVIRKEGFRWTQHKHASHRHLQSEPSDHIPPHLLAEMFQWWHQDVAITNISAHGASGSEEDFVALQNQVQELKINNLLQAYYLMRKNMTVPVAAGWQELSSKCPAGCTQLGTCNEELGRCDCPIGRGGPDCSAPVEVDCRRDLCYHEMDQMGTCYFFQQHRCVNHCNARGACISQFCHCYPGYFGADCSLSLGPDGRPELLAGLDYRPNLWGPKIYVYELPPPMSTWHPIWVDRPVAAMLWERVLSGGWRTARHEEADYFLMPMPLRFCTALQDVLRYLSSGAGLPVNYWHRHHQRDHLMVHTGDWGRCEFNDVYGKVLQYQRASDSPIANVTLLQHWGLTVLRQSVHGVELSPNFAGPCHYVNQDIIVPPDNGGMRRFVAPRSPWHPVGRRRPVNRTTLGCFAGGICGWMLKKRPPCRGHTRAYSLGVRERLFVMFHNKTDFLLEATVEDIGLEMRRSIFCFAPLGGGWGRRGAMAVQLGCIPVVISDNVTQSWEPFIDWDDFGIKVEEKDVPNLEAILRAVTPQQIADKQAKLECTAQHISWSSAWGNLFAGDDGRWDAVGTLMAVLAARKRHPGVPDDQLRSVDATFDDVMACRRAASSGGGAVTDSPVAGSTGSAAAYGSTAGNTVVGTGSSRWGGKLCSLVWVHPQSEVDRLQAYIPDDRLCSLTSFNRNFLPGGNVCDGASDLAHCVRPDLVAGGTSHVTRGVNSTASEPLP